MYLLTAVPVDHLSTIVCASGACSH